ncbi:MAG: hypothetical protein PHU25_01570 [Deltaproteobacteria bacterium]|nr:hypothetical protein [Deltaproteobacteria bacterium]
MQAKHKAACSTPLWAALLAAATLAGAPALAADVKVRDGDPGFRTDLGVHLAVGGHSCVAGGTGYASCTGTDNSWDTSWGLAGGLIVRPFSRVSVGVDVAYLNMISHQETDNTWSDLLLGPIVRYHQPLHLGSIYTEPSLGVQGGYVWGIWHLNKSNSTAVTGDNEHLGGFLAIVLGWDVFLLPRLGVGIELRLVRTFYQEVCFHWDGKDLCRGVDDRSIVTQPSSTANFPADPGAADYPWKLFYGVHGIYYF